MAPALEELLLPDVKRWRAWLARHHAGSPGVWLVLHKQGGAATTLTYAQALDEALCFGWIDGQKATRDAASYRTRFTPRRATSGWSRINVGHIARLETEGRMQAAGRAAVDAAKADGRWDRAYAPASSATVPDDLAAAIAADLQAQAMFEVLSGTNRYAIIYRINAVKRAVTRARKIQELVAMLAQGKTLHPQKRVRAPSSQVAPIGAAPGSSAAKSVGSSRAAKGMVARRR
jgi:uncharacterized protein YdeI (YjbR/CyaY-like superfamily)